MKNLKSSASFEKKNDSIIFIRSRDMNIKKIEYINIQLAIICDINEILQKNSGGKKVLGPLSKNVVISVIRGKEFLCGPFHLF